MVFAGVDSRNAAGAQLVFAPWVIHVVYGDPCQWTTSATFTRTADELVAALAGQKGSAATPPTVVSIGGVDARLIELSQPSDSFDGTTCDDDGPRSWSSLSDDARASWSTWVWGGPTRVYVIDLDGSPFAVVAHGPSATSAEGSELQSIVDSVEFLR
jgi:hypothetical protein